jgi:hypothetical protein
MNILKMHRCKAVGLSLAEKINKVDLLFANMSQDPLAKCRHICLFVLHMQHLKRHFAKTHLALHCTILLNMKNG